MIRTAWQRFAPLVAEGAGAWPSARECWQSLRTSSVAQAYLKETTGVVGVAVNPNWRKDLIAACSSVIKTVQTSGIPENAVYRQEVERLYGRIQEVCQQNEDVRDVEAKLDLGQQVEELINVAKDEVELIPKMAAAKWWEGQDSVKVLTKEEYWSHFAKQGFFDTEGIDELKDKKPLSQ